ncbi:DedA family protein [Candidatus Woesearchaeota archaeon]|nr:DedA family protein [Candidatus Woesearchaeota archaeon]
MLAVLAPILHIDQYLGMLIQEFGIMVYALLFLIIFAETGLVVLPFLPGDSLLFAAGAFAALGSLNIWTLLILLAIAAILGDTANYWIGAKVGPRVFTKEHGILFRREYLDRTHAFYDKYGTKTIILARFVPIVRTFAPFVAGIGKMRYVTFLAYNVIGGLAWIIFFVLGGFYFGNIPLVKDNFGLVIIVIIVLSVLPLVCEICYHKLKKCPTA